MTFEQRISEGIEYLERPARGPVVVLMHGIGSSAASFASVLPYLPDDWRVVAWNAPGYAGSEPLPFEWPLAADYAAALKRFLDRSAIDRAFLAGHSLGCLIGAAFAAAYGDSVLRLLLASPALGHGVPRGAQLGPEAQARIDDLTKLGPKAFAAARAARLVYEPETNSEIVARVREEMARVRPPGYAQAVRMLASGRLLDDAKRLQVPTDVIVGSNDVVTPSDSAQRTHQALRPAWRGNFTMLPAVGHAICQQAPAGFASALVALAEPVDGRGKQEE